MEFPPESTVSDWISRKMAQFLVLKKRKRRHVQFRGIIWSKKQAKKKSRFEARLKPSPAAAGKVEVKCCKNNRTTAAKRLQGNASLLPQ